MSIKLHFKQINALSTPELEVFTNSFSYHDNDYFHKDIGSLFGVIQVSDHSKNSEYLPNLLISILKKTFYTNSSKSTEDNFEFALKKANLALADLAEHDIIEWNKNLHAIIGVIHKNKLFFTQVGDALIFIGRNDKVMNLSEPNNSTNHPIKTFQDIIVGEIKAKDKIIITTPTIEHIFKFEDIEKLFKTFTNEEFDGIFLKTLKKEASNTSAVIVNIQKKKEVDYSNVKFLNNDDLPLEELTNNKNFLGQNLNKRKDTPPLSKQLSFQEKSTAPTTKKTKIISKKQALNIAQKGAKSSTTKKNTQLKESKISKVLANTTTKIVKNSTNNSGIKKIVQMSLKKTKQKIPEKKSTTTIKKISSSLPEINTSSHISIKKNTPIKKLNDLKNERQKEKSPSSISPFEEMKEIYIKDDDLAKKAKNPSTKKLKSFFHKPTATKKSTPTSLAVNKSTSINKSSTIVSTSKTPTTLASAVKISPSENKPTTKKIPSETSSIKKIFLTKVVNLSQHLNKATSLIKISWNALANFSKKRLNNFKNLRSKQTKSTNDTLNSPSQQQTKSYNHNPKNQSNSLFGKLNTSIKKVATKVLPLFQPFLKNITIFLKFVLKKISPFIKQYRLVILVILFIILVPIIIGTITKSKRNKETAEKLKLPETPIVNEARTTIENKNQTRKILSLPATIKLLAGNDNVLIAYTEDSQLYEIDKKTNEPEKLTLPENIKLSEIKAIDYIESLNLFFLSSNKATISYSPKVKKFITNKIILPTNFKLAGQNTYLSYLYLLDASSKQIYRYPLATGGFATSKKWLAKPLTHDAEISAMAIDEHVRIAYKDGTVEKYSRGKLVSTKKFELKSLDFIETTENLKSYYLLSRDEGKILKINKNNDSIEKEYQNSTIQDTVTFTVDEKNNLLYIFDDKELLSIDL